MPDAATPTRWAPTAGALTALVAAGVLHLLGRVTQGRWIALASAAVLALPVVALLTRPRLRDLEVAREVRGTPAVGRTSDVVLTVRNTGSRTTAAGQLHDPLPGHEPVVVAYPALPPGAAASVRLSRQAVQRTWVQDCPVELTAPSPLGMVRSRRSVPVAGRSVVHPAAAAATRPPDSAGAPGEGGGSRPVAGAGLELLGLRDWRHGESARAVSARASARHGRPLVLEREREGAPSLVVLVGGGSGPAWELTLSHAASVAVAAVCAGRPVDLRGLPPLGTAPLQVLDAFAAADAAPPLDGAALRDALLAAGPGGVLVVVPGLLAAGDVAGALASLRRAAAAQRCELVVLGA